MISVEIVKDMIIGSDFENKEVLAKDVRQRTTKTIKGQFNNVIVMYFLDDGILSLYDRGKEIYYDKINEPNSIEEFQQALNSI